jgi:hypothetical protein
MRKKLFTGLFIFITVIAVFVSGCAQETGSIQVTTIPESASEQNTLEPVQSSVALSPSKTAEPAGPEDPLPSESTNTAEPASTGIQLPSGEITEKKIKADVDKDSTEETITFKSKEVESDGGVNYLTKMTVSDGKKSYTANIEDYQYAFSHFISTQSGKVCILVGLEGYADYSSELYSFKGIKPVHLCSMEHINDVSGTDITEIGNVDVFGTWYYSRVYKVKDDLSIERGEYQIDGNATLHTKKKLPVEYLKNGAYTKGYVDKGKDITPVSTDGESYLKFKLEDGTEGRILYTNDYENDASGPLWTGCLINGRSEYEYFSNIEYTDEVI